MTKSLNPFRFVPIVVCGWMNQQQLQLIDYLREEDRGLREQLGQRPSRFNDEQRGRLAVRATGLGSKLLREVATIVTPETLPTWHRRLIAQKLCWQWQTGCRPTEKSGGDRGSGGAHGETKPQLGLWANLGALSNLGCEVGLARLRKPVRRLIKNCIVCWNYLYRQQKFEEIH